MSRYFCPDVRSTIFSARGQYCNCPSAAASSAGTCRPERYSTEQREVRSTANILHIHNDDSPGRKWATAHDSLCHRKQPVWWATCVCGGERVGRQWWTLLGCSAVWRAFKNCLWAQIPGQLNHKTWVVNFVKTEAIFMAQLTSVEIFR